MLNPTPASRLLDPQGRPYFLWDCDLNDAEFRARLADPDPQVRAALTGKLMRQAKPDDVFRYVTEADVRALWGLVLPYLGVSRAFWVWLFGVWDRTDAREPVATHAAIPDRRAPPRAVRAV